MNYMHALFFFFYPLFFVVTLLQNMFKLFMDNIQVSMCLLAVLSLLDYDNWSFPERFLVFVPVITLEIV